MLKKLLTGETSKEQLLELAKRLNLPINDICYVDQLRYKPNKEGNYILNLRNPAHWTGLHISGKKAFYFNSFSNLMKVPKEVIQFMKRCHCTMYYDSDKAIQRPLQEHCGAFTMDFILHMNRMGDPVENYEAFLSKLQSTNKDVIKYMIRHLH
jgi:hypothetical protein